MTPRKQTAVSGGTLCLDLHGMTCVQAQAAIDAALRRARPSGTWSAPSTPGTPRSSGWSSA